MPPEFFQNYVKNQPIVAGGLLPHEQGLGLIRMRFKAHRWFKRRLKNQDPLVFSIGWRRFQSLPLFCIEDNGGERNRMLKCVAMPADVAL